MQQHPILSSLPTVHNPLDSPVSYLPPVFSTISIVVIVFEIASYFIYYFIVHGMASVFLGKLTVKLNCLCSFLDRFRYALEEIVSISGLSLDEVKDLQTGHNV